MDDVRSGRAHREGGFSLIELIVAMIIMVILGAAVFAAFKGAKKNTYYKDAQAIAMSYSEAIEAYMADNGQRPPAISGTNPMADTWPASPQAKMWAGPRDATLTLPNHELKPYMTHGTPEHVQDGLIGFGPNKSGVTDHMRAFLTYSVTPDGQYYRIKVETLSHGSATEEQCVVTNATSLAPGEKRCG